MLQYSQCCVFATQLHAAICRYSLGIAPRIDFKHCRIVTNQTPLKTHSERFTFVCHFSLYIILYISLYYYHYTTIIIFSPIGYFARYFTLHNFVCWYLCNLHKSFIFTIPFYSFCFSLWYNQHRGIYAFVFQRYDPFR